MQSKDSKPEQWCKCIVCVEYFVSADKKEHQDSYEHNRRIAMHDGDILPEYIFDVKELPIECAPYYSGEMPTKAELQMDFYCATNNLHEFEMDIDYYTRKLDELGGDISDMKELLNRIEEINTTNITDSLKKPTVYDSANMYDQIQKFNAQIEPMNLWKDENTAWNLQNNVNILDKTEINTMNPSNHLTEQDYIEQRLLELALKESEDFYKPLDDETDELISKIEILDIEQEKIKNNYLESLLGEPTVKIQNALTEDEIFESSEDNIEIDDDFDFDSSSDS
ncbi:hypothetical protein PV-S19_0346 [Pacmanvirus S19]|nr:hypothetical protein PV-S19_0346 [Pacmanvirus S19]